MHCLHCLHRCCLEQVLSEQGDEEASDSGGEKECAAKDDKVTSLGEGSVARDNCSQSLIVGVAGLLGGHDEGNEVV